MADLELSRMPGERRRYQLEGVGTLRLMGLAWRRATAAADAGSWVFARGGLWQRVVQATNEAGAVVGAFEPHTVRSGGLLRWAGHEFALRPASRWRERYALADGAREIAVLHGKGWGRRPVRVTIDDPRAVEPGLLLFAAFVVSGLAEDAAVAAGGAGLTGGGPGPRRPRLV